MASVGLRRKTSVAWIAGTVAVPIAVATYRVQDLTPDIEKAIVLAEDSMVGEYQNAPARAGGRFMEFGFTTELRGSDVADQPPPDGVLLRGVGFVESENGTTPDIGHKYVLGNPLLATGTPAGSLYPVDFETYQHGLYRKADNCVGSVVISFIAGQIPTFGWNWRGQVVTGMKGGVTDYSPPAFSVQANPKPVQSAAMAISIVHSGAVTGVATGAASPTVLIDATATFNTDGVMVGDAVVLDVGGETADVVSIQSETQLTTGTLSAAGSYDPSEAYTITKATPFLPSGLVVPSLVCDLGNILDPRGDINGAHGFSQPIITGRAPVYTMVVEVPSLHQMNFERSYIEGETLDISWKHEVGLGDQHALDCKLTGVINSMPVLSEQDGKNIYTVTMDQGITTGDDPLTLSWQGT